MMRARKKRALQYEMEIVLFGSDAYTAMMAMAQTEQQ